MEFLQQEFQESRKNSESSTTTTEEEFQESPSGSCALTTTTEEEFQESEVEKNPSVAAGVGALSGNLEILGILPGVEAWRRMRYVIKDLGTFRQSFVSIECAVVTCLISRVFVPVRSGVGEKVTSDFRNSRDSWDSPDLTAGAEEPMSGLEPAVLAAVAFTSRPFGPRSCLPFVSRYTSSRSAHAPAPPAGECAYPSCGAGRHARFACTGRSGCGATRRSDASRRHFIRTIAAGGRADRTTPCGM